MFNLPQDWRVYATVGALAVLVVYLAQRQARSAAGAVGAAVNPWDSNNMFYRGTNETGKILTGDKDFSLGVWMWEQLNPNQAKRDNQIASGASGTY